MIELKSPFSELWKNKDPFIETEKLTGEVFRQLETRKTLQFELGNKSYFIKIHYGTTLKEVLKNLVSFRLPVLGADREWNAIHRLEKIGVDTMNGRAYGQKGFNPLRRHSFIITEALVPTISLEDFCKSWCHQPPLFNTKILIIRRIAEMVKKMHAAGINHRDCYICHFLLHLPFDGIENNLKISVIDLHRAQIRKSVPRRWRNKDLVGLYFSSLTIGLTDRDRYRFMKIYFNSSLKDIFNKEEYLIKKVHKKADNIKERTLRKGL
ncbi:lipopolysaccharide core heptose(I) kinase RfaP [Moellerella wisconsensis]|uniref:Lipopolysaccharide core heptose(I) kinase RfaP n=1 Tax=Moellerella wisconsensis TaxID=158849 RepID=A0ACD3Y6W9_9GAMM|nr:lipopolysaccharide core heptose(I) kinase RfaP [Moellerella wisconsensis]UNH38878.1 lipopolysaccharide core heptose(I) kinase RfaP [Moellerella wisconsensis]WJW81855.1 lipopolysaccharide core heptose(I) kinase RfaP [Moellerella wisconsensis]